MFKNTGSQKITVYAVDASTGLPKTGDSANITAYVSKDDGTVTVLGDTSATETDATNAKGDYLFDLTQAETNADKLRFSGKSTTANVVIVPQTVYTVPAAFGLVAGASGGLIISGSNSGTTTLGALTVTGTTTLTGGLTGNITGNLSGSVDSVTGSVGSVSGVTFPANFGALLVSAGGHISNVDTLTTYTGDTPQTGDSFGRIGVLGAGLTAVVLAAAGLNAVLVDGKTLPVSLQYIAASTAGKVSGGGTGTEIFLGLDGVTTRLTITVDASGNRSAITYG